MRLVRGVLLSGLAVAIVAISPAAAEAKNPIREIRGSRTDTLTLSPTTGLGTNVARGHFSHFGKWTSTNPVQFMPTGLTTFNFFSVGQNTAVFANGDRLFSTFRGSGHTNGDGTSTSENTFTIVGGTGRFANATGTISETIASTLMGLDPAGNQIFHDSAKMRGTISY